MNKRDSAAVRKARTERDLALMLARQYHEAMCRSNVARHALEGLVPLVRKIRGNEDAEDALPTALWDEMDAAINTYDLAVRERPRVVCFCGSSRFVEEMAVLMWECEKGGEIAMGLHLLPANAARRADGSVIEHHLAEEQGVGRQMDELSLRKIDLADRVFVVNVGGYVGESTRREIEYATAHGKPVSYLEPQDA